MGAKAKTRTGEPGVLSKVVVALACLVLTTLLVDQNLSRADDLIAPVFQAWQRPHEGQLTIEWPKTAKFHYQTIGDRLALKFAHPPAEDIRSQLQQISNFINPERATFNKNVLELTLKPGVVSNVRVQGKRRVTVNFSRPPMSSQPPSTVVVSTIDQGIRLAIDWPGPTHVQAIEDINSLQLNIVPPRRLDPEDLTVLKRSLKPWLHNLTLASEGGSTTLAFTLDTQVKSSIRRNGATQTTIEFMRNLSSPVEPAAGPSQHIFRPSKRPPIAPAIAERAWDAPPLPKRRPTVQDGSAATNNRMAITDRGADSDDEKPETLHIDWSEPAAAAVFVRSGHLWAVFDVTDASLLESFPKSPAPFGPGSIVPADNGFAMRFPILEPVNIRVRKTPEGDWQIDPVTSNGQPRPLEIEHGDGSSSLRILPLSGQQIVSFTDPDVGDRLDILPMVDPGVGQPVQRRFVDFELLPTAQGVAWRPLNDRLTTKIDGETLVFGTPLGLSLSKIMQDQSEPRIVKAVAKKDQTNGDREANDRQQEAKQARPRLAKRSNDSTSSTQQPSSYFNLAKAGVERELVNEYRRIRRQAIAKAAPERRDQARLNLARLLVSERLGTEARIVLNAISDNANENVMRQKLALSGVSAFLIGHRAKASNMLLDPGLNDDSEIDIWRAALESTESRWQAAAGRWRNTSELLDVYPPRLKLDLGLMALETAIETNDEKMIRRGMRRLKSLDLDAYDQARFDAIRALNAERSGDLDKARAILLALTSSPNRKVRTIADFELAALAGQSGTETIAALDALDLRMPLWRGHPEEQTMLDKLARRYRDANALRKALTIWRKLTTLYPQTADNENLSLAQRETFSQAIVNDKEPALDQLDVYAIYLDFPDLVPDDPEARELHRHLAGHLEGLNLLDEAMSILQPLMTSAADDFERVELETKVASLMLRQNRASPAIALLNGTRPQNIEIPRPQQEQRLLLRARALIQLSRPDEALRTIRDLRSQQARRLRAEIYWKEQSWPRLAAAVEAYFEDTEPSSPLVEDEQELVLWLALARQKGGKQERLGALRKRFSLKMQEGPFATAFDVATQTSVQNGDIRSLLAATGEQLAEIERFRRATSASR